MKILISVDEIKRGLKEKYQTDKVIFLEERKLFEIDYVEEEAGE